jgi:hypothetical protein
VNVNASAPEEILLTQLFQVHYQEKSNKRTTEVSQKSPRGQEQLLRHSLNINNIVYSDEKFCNSAHSILLLENIVALLELGLIAPLSLFLLPFIDALKMRFPS